MNPVHKITAAFFSLVFAGFVGGLLSIAVTDYSHFTILPVFIFVCLYAFFAAFRGMLTDQTPEISVKAAIFSGISAPGLFALYLIESFGTLHGIALWLYPLSFLTVGFSFGKTTRLRFVPQLDSGKSNDLSAAIFIVPALACLIAFIVLREAAMTMPNHPVLLNMYFGLMFSLFAEKMPVHTMNLVSVGGLLFPMLLIFGLLFVSKYSLIIGLVAVIFFILGFVDGSCTGGSCSDSDCHA